MGFFVIPPTYLRKFSKTVVCSTGTVERQTGFENSIFLLRAVESHVCVSITED